MKCLFTFTIFVVFFGVSICNVSAQNLVPDANLAAVIRDELGLAADTDITIAHLESLDELFGISSGITDLTGLEHATNLREVFFRGSQISNISPLENLTELRELNFSENQIGDISPLENFASNLDKLYLRGNPIRDFSPLSGLTSLTVLGVEDTLFSDSDITLLAGLVNLESLILSRTQIRDITNLGTVLSGMNSLTTLHLSGNQLTDISPLSSVTIPLEGLALTDNQIRDLTPLGHFTSLTQLHLDDNNITDVTPLGNLINLQWRLHIRNNQIRDISPLRTLTKLVRLYMGGNQVSDLTPLESLTELTTLEICYNPYTDISPLANLPKLGTNATYGRLHIDEEFWEDPANANMIAVLSQVDRVTLCPPLPEPLPEPLSSEPLSSEPTVKRRRIIYRCELGWTPQSQFQRAPVIPKVMIYALGFGYDPGRNAGYNCKAIEIRTGDASIENLAGWKLYLGTLYNPIYSPLKIPEEHAQITDGILRLTPDMLGLETFPCNTVGGISHPLPGVHYVLKTDENILVDTAYSCFIYGQNVYITVDGVNVESERSVSSAALREMEVPRLERYITNPSGIFITYTSFENFAWDRVVLSDWLLAVPELSAPGAPSAIRRKLVGTWGALKRQ